MGEIDDNDHHKQLHQKDGELKKNEIFLEIVVTLCLLQPKYHV